MARVLITRAQPEADDTAMAAAAAGHGTVVAPIFSVRLLKPEARLPLGAYAGILLTSRNAVRGFLNGFRPDPETVPPIFTVGRRTAALAQAHGLKIAGDADGNAESLADLLLSRRSPRPPGPLLHPGGTAVSPMLMERLSAAGFRVDAAATYAVEAYEALPVAAVRALETRTLDAALFFSPRSADIFARLVRTSGLANATRPITGVCISQATADRLANSLPEMQRLTVAAHPSLDGLISALGSGPSDASPGRPAAVMARLPDDGAEDGADKTIMVEKDAARSNATDAVITAFGGLRPMAKALGITASTVQGWKKRGAIPENRHDAIRQAAEKGGVALEAPVLAASAPAPDPDDAGDKAPKTVATGSPQATAPAAKPADTAATDTDKSASEKDAADTSAADKDAADPKTPAATTAAASSAAASASAPATRSGSVPGTRSTSQTAGAAAQPAASTPATKSTSAVASSSPSPAQRDPAAKSATSDSAKATDGKPSAASGASPSTASPSAAATDTAGKAAKSDTAASRGTGSSGGGGQDKPPAGAEKAGSGGAALATVALLVGVVGVASPWWAPLIRDPAVPAPVEQSLADLRDRVGAVESAVPEADLTALTERVAALEESMAGANGDGATDAGGGDGATDAGGGVDPARVEALSEQIARLGERLDTVAADADSGDLSAGITALDNEIETLTDRLAGTTETVGLLRTRIEALEAVSTADGSLRGAVGDLADRVDGLSDRTDAAVDRLEGLASQVSAETAADTTTQAMMLAVGQLRSALDQGRAFLAPLTTLASVAGADPALDEAVTMLMPVSTTGVKTRDQLVAEFPNIVRSVREAETIGEEAPWYRRALASVQELVTVRPAPGEVPGTDPDAILARAEGRLDRGNLEGAIDALSELEGRPLAAAAVWIAEARARLDAEIALDRLTEAAIVRLGVAPPTAPAETETETGSTGQEG